MENRFKLPLIALTAGLFSLQVDAQTNTFPSTGNTGIGTTTPSDYLHIKYGASGGTPYQAKGLTIEGDTRTILQFLSDNTSDQYLMFGKASLANRAWVGYNHSTNEMNFTHYSTAGNFVFENGKVGIGTHAPMAYLHVVVDGNGANFNRYGANAAPVIYLQKANGTEAAPTIVANNDVLGHYMATGYTGGGSTGFQGAGSIQFAIDGTPGINDVPGRIVFNTVQDNGTALYERMRITNSGNVGINTTAPTAKFHAVVDGNGANIHRYGGIPYLYLGRTNGTESSKTPTLINEVVGALGGTGYDGTNHLENAAILFGIDATPGANDMPGRIMFRTTPDGNSSGAERMRITNIGYVGINTTAPKGFFHANLDGNGANFQRYAGPAAVSLKRANGTESTPTIVTNNEVVGVHAASAYDGATYLSSSSIQFDIDGAPGLNDMPGRIKFLTTPDGSASVVERMRITNAGNVGIGTTTPSTKFEISGTENFNWLTTFNNTATNGHQMYFGYINTDGASQGLHIAGGTNNANARDLLIGSNKFLVRGDGYVGIGTATPQGTLHVVQDGNLTRIDRYAGGAGIMLRRANGNSTTPTAVASSEVLGTLTGSGYDGTSAYNAAAQVVISADGAGTTTAMPGRISFLTTPGGSLVPQEIVRINSAGKMGVGTTAPSSRLHVMGVAAGEYAMTVEHSNSLGNGLLIKAGGAGSNMNPLTIVDNTGGEILKVRGADKTLYVRELEVRIGAFPDYVFDKNYPLMPLSELEAYINTNKHLPNVPSAQEVEENGANVGNLVKVQMEKIEELTLYLIELKKENEEIKKQLEELKDK